MSVRRRTALLAALGLVAVVGTVFVVGSRPDCTVDDADRPAVTDADLDDVPDLSVWGLRPQYAVAVDRPLQIVSTPDTDVVVTVPDEDGGAVLSGLDPGTGRVGWSVGVPGAGVQLATTGLQVVGATLYEQARIFALDARVRGIRSCHGLGSVDTGGYVAPGGWAPLAVSGSVAVTSWDDDAGGPTIGAVDVDTGRELWTVPGGAGSLHPVPGGVLTGSGRFLDAASGAGNAAEPGAEVVATGEVTAVLVRDDELVAVDAADPAGPARWTAPLHGRGEHPGSTMADGVVVTNDFDGEGRPAGLRGLDATTGTLLWERTAGRTTGTDQQVLVADRDGVWAGGPNELVRVDARTGNGTPVPVGRPGLRELAVAPDGRVLIRLGDRLVGYTPGGP
ncbi:PQQ-binding-like beta-propeller repeat protein [Pseudonocardia nematodicida]|uniref:PQQ-binding-like beta-propeller repeat protein n=1 Tax=Pseudonocardia nematodicida TaxID=1206997 RepID=A0ABV1KEW3_9PSEU